MVLSETVLVGGKLNVVYDVGEDNFFHGLCDGGQESYGAV